MNQALVTTAFQLYVDTVPMATMSADHPDFHDLYSKECQLFDLMRQFDWQESEEYKYRVRMYNNGHGISNENPWSEEDEYEEENY